MKGVAARYPAFDDKRGTAVDLEGRINICRIEQQKAPALALESKDLLALTTYVARQSRGMPIESSDARLKPFIDTGRAIFERRQGQLNLACAHCHDDNWGQKLAGITMPQGHPTGYPLYRLEWQTLGSLQRRLRNCMIGMRAETYAYGSPEYRRARGVPDVARARHADGKPGSATLTIPQPTPIRSHVRLLPSLPYKSAVGTKLTSASMLRMPAFGGKADEALERGDDRF